MKCLLNSILIALLLLQVVACGGKSGSSEPAALPDVAAAELAPTEAINDEIGSTQVIVLGGGGGA